MPTGGGSAIVSANVGGMTAGQIVIPEPRLPSKATWPDIIKKTTADILAIFTNNLRSKKEKEEGMIGPPVAPGITPTAGGVRTAAVFGLPVLIFVGILLVAFQPRLLGRIF